MIDTDKYEGHTKGHNGVGWRVNNNFVSNGECPNFRYIAYVRHDNNGTTDIIEFSDADASLIADAPLHLAEVKRLREAIADIANNMEAADDSYMSGFIEDLRKVVE